MQGLGIPLAYIRPWRLLVLADVQINWANIICHCRFLGLAIFTSSHCIIDAMMRQDMKAGGLVEKHRSVKLRRTMCMIQDWPARKPWPNDGASKHLYLFLLYFFSFLCQIRILRFPFERVLSESSIFLGRRE
jgi:hypothetical protein